MSDPATTKTLSPALLAKLLGMTGSDNDGEALVAIRKANAHIKAAGKSWHEIIHERITVIGDPFGDDLPDFAAPKRSAPKPPPPQYAPNPQPAPPPPPPPPQFYGTTSAEQLQISRAWTTIGSMKPWHDRSDWVHAENIMKAYHAVNKMPMADWNYLDRLSTKLFSLAGNLKSEKDQIDSWLLKTSLMQFTKAEQDDINRIERVFSTHGQITLQDYNMLSRYANQRRKKI